MKHFAIFLSAISVLLLSGCQEKIEKGKKEAWNRTVDTVAISVPAGSTHTIWMATEWPTPTL